MYCYMTERTSIKLTKQIKMNVQACSKNLHSMGAQL